MRCCAVPAARILTFISLALLSAHSFTLANAQDSPSGVSLSNPVSSPTDSFGAPSGSPPAYVSPTDPAGSPAPSPSPSSPSAVPSLTPSQPPPSDSPTPTAAPSSGSDSAPAPSSSPSFSSPVVQSSALSSSSPFSAVSSSSSFSSSSSSSSTSSSSLSSSSSSSAPSFSQSSSSSAPTLVVPAASNNAASTPYKPYTPVPTGSGIQSLSAAGEASSPLSSAGSSGASSKGFFSNTGAVAGVFTVVGLVIVGTFVGMIAYCKRRQRLQDDEDAAYFEKEPDFNHQPDSSFHVDSPSIVDMTMPAPMDAYPDRATHFGDMPPEEPAYGAGNLMYSMPDPTYGTSDPAYGTNFPRGTAYAAAAASGGQYQYTGQPGGYGAEYSTYYQSAGSHPYANPNNSYRTGGAPPVQQIIASEHSSSHYEEVPDVYQVDAE